MDRKDSIDYKFSDLRLSSKLTRNEVETYEEEANIYSNWEEGVLRNRFIRNMRSNTGNCYCVYILFMWFVRCNHRRNVLSDSTNMLSIGSI